MFEMNTTTTAPETETSSTISDARLAANRENAQKSTGPATPEGKAKCRLNAVTHGLTTATVLLVTKEDCQRYLKHTADYLHLYQPVGPQESALVQSITDLWWRLSTIPVLELAIIAHGSRLLIDSNPDFFTQPGNQATLALEARRKNEKELRNLQLQENRLSRRRERETAELERLQTARKANEEEALAEAAKTLLLAMHEDPEKAAKGVSCPGVGFAFSKDRFNTYFRRLKPVQKQKLLQEALAEAAEEPETMEAAA